MLWTDLTRQAYNFALTVHRGQVDRAGVPYIQHPVSVANQLTDEYEVCAALLHDVVEDTIFSLMDLVSFGYPQRVVQLVDLLTRPAGMCYMDYIKRLSVDASAVRIKLADLNHNLAPERIEAIPSSLALRYKRARKYLMGL